MPKEVKILGIETSCDDTAAAVVSFDGEKFNVLSNVVASQIPIHQLTGGVVPEVAAREHVTAIVPTIEMALNNSGINFLPKETLINNIDSVAVTAGPGLLPALMVGVDTANSLAFATNIPIYGIQHITGHIYANFLGDNFNIKDLEFPLLALIVSGGHTEYILMKSLLEFEKVGQTIDDASGEAFDKTAKMLGLPYPGGPAISKTSENGSPKTFDFPRPMIGSGDLNFSFSGLKTSVLYTVQKLTSENKTLDQQTIANLSASIQDAIVETLIKKTETALEQLQPKTFTIGGGVSANTKLREQMKNLFKNTENIRYIEPQIKYSSDNASMIAAVGAMKLFLGEKPVKRVSVNPRWEIEKAAVSFSASKASQL